MLKKPGKRVTTDFFFVFRYLSCPLLYKKHFFSLKRKYILNIDHFSFPICHIICRIAHSHLSTSHWVDVCAVFFCFCFFFNLIKCQNFLYPLRSTSRTKTKQTNKQINKLHHFKYTIHQEENEGKNNRPHTCYSNS